MIKQVSPDAWSLKEQLGLATAVLRSGDQNWVAVARQMRSFTEEERPQDWFSQKNCALQYNMLLEQIAHPKRKRNDKPEVAGTPGEEILKKLKDARIAELSRIIEDNGIRMAKIEEDISLLEDSNTPEEVIDRIEKDADRDEEDETEKQMALGALIVERDEKRRLSGENQRSRGSSSHSRRPSAAQEGEMEDAKQDIVKEEKKPSATELSSPLLSSLLKAPSNVALQPILAQQVESTPKLNSEPTVDPKPEVDGRILLVDAHDVDIDDVEEIEPDLSPEADIKPSNDRFRPTSDQTVPNETLKETEGSNFNTGESKSSQVLVEHFPEEDKDGVNKSLVEEIGYSTESNASDESTESGGAPEDEECKSDGEGNTMAKADADRSMSIESCVEVDVSPIREEIVSAEASDEDEDKDEENQLSSNRDNDLEVRLSNKDNRRSSRNSARRGRFSEVLDDESSKDASSVKREFRSKNLSEQSEETLTSSSLQIEASIDEPQTPQPSTVTPGVARGTRRSIVKKTIPLPDTLDESLKDEKDSALAQAPENKRVSRVKEQEGPTPSKTRRGSGGTQTTSRSSSPVPSGEESESDMLTPRTRTRRKSGSGNTQEETKPNNATDGSEFKLTEEWQKLAIKLLEDVKKHKLFAMVAEKGRIAEQASHEPRNFDLLSTNIMNGTINNVQTFQAEFLLVLVNITLTFKADEFSSLVKSVFQNFYESLGSLVDTPLQEKIASIKVSNSSSRSRRKEDDQPSKNTRSDKRESTPSSSTSTPLDDRRKRSAPSDEPQISTSSSKKRKR